MSFGGQNNWPNGGRGGRGGRTGGYAGGRTGRGTLRSRGTGGGYAGRGRGAPMQQFDSRNAPTEPASMRAPQQQRPAATSAAPRGGAAGRGRGNEHGRDHASSGGDGHRDARLKFSNCMRCGAFKGESHPDFADCKAKCDLCDSYNHEGKMCGRVYASVKWHSEHNGFLPEEVQFRPSPEQCKAWASTDKYFGTVTPVADLIDTPAQGTKRKVDVNTDDLEIERRKAKVADDFRKERLAQYERRCKEYEDKLAAEQSKRLESERLVREYKLALRQSQDEAQKQLKKNAQKEEEITQLCERVYANAEEIRTLKDAVARRDMAEAEAEVERLRLVEENLSARAEAAKWKSLYEQTNSKLQALERAYNEIGNGNEHELTASQVEIKQETTETNELALRAQEADLDVERAVKVEDAESDWDKEKEEEKANSA